MDGDQIARKTRLDMAFPEYRHSTSVRIMGGVKGSAAIRVRGAAPDTQGESVSTSAVRIQEFLQKATRPARHSGVVTLLVLVSALLLVSGQGLDNARSSEITASVERNLEVEEAATTLEAGRVRAQSDGPSHPTDDESFAPQGPKGSNREATAAGLKPAQEEDWNPDEKSSGRSSRRIVARPDGTETKTVPAAGSEKGDQAEEALPYVRAVEISSSPQGGRSGYGIGELVSVVVTFSEPVAVTGTPILGLRVGEDAKQAIYESGAASSKLVFAYSVIEGDEDTNGVGIEANSLSLDGGMIRGESGDAALLGHERLGDDPLHQADGIRPALAAGKEASAKKDTLMLTFAEALDGSLTPEAEDFKVEVEGKDRDVSEVVVGGSTVRLSLASAVKAGESVTVSYAADTEAEAQPIRDAAGNGASGFTEQTVTNRTGNSGDRAGGTIPLRTVRQIEALLAKKAERTPSQRKVSSRLLDTVPKPGEQAPTGARREAAETDASAPEGLVTVDIRANVTPEVLSRIRALGGIVVNSVPKYRAIRAQLPPGAVEPLARLDAVQTIRPGDKARTRGQRSALPPIVRADVPDTPVTRKDDTSAGDTAHRAGAARRTHSVTGSGIGIGVISNGVRTLADRQASGDVPARVNVLPGQEGRGDEGTAILEIVYDLAPGAELYFATGDGGQAQVAANIEALCDAGADVILDDVGYFLEASFQDDLIAQGVNAAVGDGCFYFSAAGNDGNLNDGTSGVWEGDYSAGSPLTVEGETAGVRHDFGGGMEANELTGSGFFRSSGPIILQWADPLGASSNDYDLFLINEDGDVVASSTDTQDGTQDPIESISGGGTSYTLVVVKVTGADRYLRLQAIEGRLQIATAGAAYGHAAAENTVSVAAVDVRTAAGSGKVFNGTESVRTTNSDGPRRIFFQPDGTPITSGDFSETGGKLLRKPDLTAASCVSTATPGFSTFCGTSAAAPHAAAIAALMVEAAGGPKHVTQKTLLREMTGSALDIEADGFDRDAGAGIVMAPGAVGAAAVPRAERNRAPTAVGTLPNRTLAPGADPVTIDMATKFTDPDNDALTYTVASSDTVRLAIGRNGSMVTLTPGSPGRVLVRLGATDPGGLTTVRGFSVTVTAGGRDYDADNDGLIEVSTLAQLDALRYDLNGDGLVDGATWMPYYAAFRIGALGMGCPDGCTGYELEADLDFDTDGSGEADLGDTYWNGGAGWDPIGGEDAPFAATFNGNGHTIANLIINRPTEDEVGLFGEADRILIDGVGVVGADVTGQDGVGSLLGRGIYVTVRNSHASGEVTGRNEVGGLVGGSSGSVGDSYAAVRVSGTDGVGGLVGHQFLNRIVSSFATGNVSGTNAVGGLVGAASEFFQLIQASYAAGGVSGTGAPLTDSDSGFIMCGFDGNSTGGGVGGLVGSSCGEIEASYAVGPVSGTAATGGLVGTGPYLGARFSYWDLDTSGMRVGVGSHDVNDNGVIDGTESPRIGVGGMTTSELQAPTDYEGIYETWNVDLNPPFFGAGEADDPWDFGTATQYPVLSRDLNGVGGATWQEFGYQIRAGPNLTASTANGQAQVNLSWTAADLSSWSPAPGITYTVTRDNGTTVATIAQGLTGTAYNDTGVTVGTRYTYRLMAVVDGGVAARSAPVPVTAGRANQPPVAVGTLANRSLQVGSMTSVVVEVSGAFSDPDDDTLTYGASSSSSSVASVSRSGTQVTITPGSAGQATVTVTATDASGSNTSATQRFTVKVGNDYDSDGDGLIEIRSLAQLDAVHYDLNGNGIPDNSDDSAAYTAIFPSPLDRMGCGFEGCSGYELEADLDFDTNGSGDADSGDTYWNDGEGWVPLGLPEFEFFTTLIGAFRTTFEGNGHSISNLFVDRGNYSGLFAGVALEGAVRNLSLIDVDVTGTEAVGGLIGDNRGLVTDVRTSGRVFGELQVGGLIGVNLRLILRGSSSVEVTSMEPPTVFPPGVFVIITSGVSPPGTGGLVGVNTGFVVSSYATGSVTSDTKAGGLVGFHQDKLISGSYATGRVKGSTVGGLVGENGLPFQEATIRASSATGSVDGSTAGGLVGRNESEGIINASYATGHVPDGNNRGGLVGKNERGTVTNSYWDTRTSGHGSGSPGSGRTTSQLQSPTGYSGIYGSWNVDVDADDASDNPWDFGTGAQYPALKSVVGDDQAMWQEFGYQLREGPSLTASTTPGMAQVALTWTAPVVTHWTTAPAVTYTLTRDDGTSLETLATDLSGLQYTDTGVTPGATYHYQVTASVSGGEPARSARVSATVPSTTAPYVSSIGITSDGGYTAGETIQVTVTFSQAVTVTGSPQLTLNVGGMERTAGYVSVTGAAVLFSYTVAAGESDRNGVSIGSNSFSLNGGSIKDNTDTTDAVLKHPALADDRDHWVDGVKPELLSTGGAVVNGATLKLTYDSWLDQMSVPPASAFTVAGGNSARTVSGVALATTNFFSDQVVVTLTLTPAVEHGETGITLTYTVPTGMGASPIQDSAGNDAAALVSQAVTNETPEMTAPTVSTVAIASTAGTDRFYVPGDRIEAAVTFSERVEVTGAPQLMLEVGGVGKAATYYGRGSGKVLVFSHTVADGDSDTDGVEIEANQLALNGGTIKDAADNNAVLDHQAVAADTRHRVDGVKPGLAATGGAVVNLATLTLTYEEPLDGNSTPSAGAFTVAGGSQTRTVTDVEVSGSAVELTLDSAVDHGETGIKVSYKVPRGVMASPVRDAVGNAAVPLTNVAVTNETPDTSPPKVSTLSFSSDPGTNRTYAAGDDIQVTVTFSKEVSVTGSPQLTLNVGGEDRTAGYGSVTGAAVTFSYRVAAGESDTDGVSIDANSLSLNSGTIKDSTDDTDAVLNHRAVAANAGHKVDGVKPELAATGGAVVNGTTLTLTYDEPLDGSSTPEASTFTVAGGSQSRTVTGVRVSGSTVELTLDPAVEQGEMGIRVSYSVPTGMGASPIRDAVGNEALGLSSEPVTNETPDTKPPTVSMVEITSDPGSDRIYVPEDEIQVTVTFSETVDVERTPRLMLKVGDRNRPAGYLEGTGTTDLVFGYEVVDGDEDSDGVSIDANSLSLSGGTIKDASKNSADLDHDGLAADSGHKVDGAGPDLAETDGAVVDGTTLTLTYDEPLDGSSSPPTTAFTVTGGSSSRTVTDVALSGSAAVLTLDPAVEHGETGIRVSYTVPTGMGASPVRDVLGNDAGRLSNVPVTNETPDTTSPMVSKLEITSNPGTDRTYAAEDDIQVTVTFSETVEVTGAPQLSLELGGGSRTATYGGGSGTAALVFEYEVADGESDTDGVGVEADSLSGGTIRDEARNNAELDHDGVAADAGHKVDGVKPDLATTGGAVVDGTTLTLTYDETLDGSSTPEAGDFTVSGGDQARTVTRVSVSGSTVVLTLDAGAKHLEAGIQVSYTPGTNKIRDVPGNQAEGLSRESVRNDTPDTTPPEVSSLGITSNPGSDRTYAAGDEIQVTVSFSETVKVEGTPQLRLRVGSRTRTAGYESGTDTAALVFGYQVADGDEDTGGVSIEAGRIALNRGTIEDEAENAAELAHEALAAQAGHKVDGVRPSFLSAAVDGSSLTLTYGEALDGGSRPASGDFTVEVGGSGRSVTGVSVSGSVVTLTLNPAVEHGDTGIRVSYTVPTGVGANPIQDEVGNDARGLSSRSVTNTTGAPNTDPEITSPSSFDVPENQSVARRLAARDTDPGDEVTGWAIVGGADQSEFSIASDTGELSFRDPPDFEAPGDNEYVVTVEVRSGAGARELEAEQTFTIRVTDEREPPEVPEAPVISGETADSLQVSWNEPDNTGPAITDYDVQYREKGTGRFIDGDQQGPGRTLTLEDLEPGTVYEVQVRATNDEGMSDWSDPGEGMTVAPLRLEMMTMEEPPVSGPFTVRFSFSEPVTGFGGGHIDTEQDPACVDDQNNTVFCDPGIGGLQTADNRVFTTTVTPWTNRVAHSYTLRLTVAGGAVRSSVGSKPNEEPEEPLAVRVAPPGVEEPISSMGLRASVGSGSVRLSWNRPSDNGGSAIIRYEVRYQAVGEAWSDWENVGAGSRGVTVGNLVNGREYVFEVRAVNALGKGGAETVQATPERRIAPPPPPPPPPGNGGGGGGLLFPPEAPLGLMAMAGEGAVRLEWSPPESDGGTPILRYEYRLKEGRGEFGEWTPIADSAPGEVNASGYTVEGLGNGTVYVFELRAVNLVGEGPESEAVEAVMGLDPAYWSNFGAEDLQGVEASLERGPFGGGPQSLRLRFGAGLRFEESELDGDGEVTGTRMGGYGYRYTSRTTGELRLDYDEGEACELRLTFRGVGAGSYSIRCGGVLGGQGSFRMSGLNRAPEITSAGAYEVAENTARVGRIEAVDGDDEIGGYGIAGGADGGLFAVVEETGELMFREAPDYESPGDVASDDPQSGVGDNEYMVVVEVRSGEGERERKGSRAIRVRVSDEEEPPEITSLGPFEVVENQTRVGQLEAVDQDKQDEITEYGIAGGADGELFAVVEETGELLFREAPDYETPSDVESAEPVSGAADNEYIVVVEVRSGAGERERKGRRAIRVRVADEEEPPGAPAAPVVTAEGSDSLQVSWREPENRGPEIVDYEVRYREVGEEGYSDGGQEGIGLTATLSGLKEGTVYEVQVRAVNQEGMSEWSEPGEGRTDPEEADPEDPSDFTEGDLEGRRLTLRQADADGTTRSLELRFGEDNRFEQIESGGQEAATRSESAASRSGSYAYEKTGPGRGTVRLTYDDGSSCEVLLAFTESGAGTFSYDCGGGDPAEGSFRLTTGSLFVPVILSAAGQNRSFFTSELTLTNRGEREVRLDYAYTAHRGGGSGKTSDVLAPGMQKIETDALTYLRGLGIAIPETGNRIGTLRVEARLGSEVEAVVRTTTVVPEGRAGLAYLGVAEEEGFDEAVYLCGLRQNGKDRSNVAFQNMGAPEEGAITIRTTVYSGESTDTNARVLEEVKLEPGGFHQYSGLLGRLESVEGNRQGYVKVERVKGTAPFYAYGVINDQANSDGSFVFPVTSSSLQGTAGQTLPVIVETSNFTSELTVTNFSEEPRRLTFEFVSEQIKGDDKRVGFSMMLEAGEQQIVPELVEELRQQGVAGLGTSRGFYAGPLFVEAEDGDMSGIVIGARTGSEGGGGQYSVFYNAVPLGAAFSQEAWVDGLQQNQENRSNLALVNTGEVDGSASVFHLEIYNGETGLLAETVVTKPIPARGWHQINGILGRSGPETRQGYIRIEKVSGENPFLAYGVVNDGGAPGERSGDGAYLPARE